MTLTILVPVIDEEYMLREVQVELTDEQILAIGDEYAKLKRERIFKNKDCKDCVHYGCDPIHYECDIENCENKDRWKYGGE